MAVNLIETIKKQGSKFTRFYDEEKAALMDVLKWREINPEDTIIIYTYVLIV